MDANITKRLHGEIIHISIIDDEVYVDGIIATLLEEMKLQHKIIGNVAYLTPEECGELLTKFINL